MANNNTRSNESSGDGTAHAGLAQDFRTYFVGRETAYGQFLPSGTVSSKGKIEGKVSTITAPVTNDLYLAHLKGEKGLGIVPIRENNTVSFSVIDIDVYNTVRHKEILASIHELNLPIVPFKSKSGGLHLYCFFTSPVAAHFAIETMSLFRSLLNLPDDTEIFPKQSKVAPGNVGNWINLPYFGGANESGIACAIGFDNEPILRVADALRLVKGTQVSKEDITLFIETLPLQDAPPCLQRIYLTGAIKGHRNDYLFSLGRYFKTKLGDGEDFEKALQDANSRLDDPLSLNELATSVLTSLKKKDYSYSCSKEPMCNFCNKKVCMKRKYGIGGKEISNLDFGEFRQILTEPPTYEWEVNSKVLKFSNASALADQSSFITQCIDKLHVFPNRLSMPAWVDIVQNALRNVKVIKIDPDEDISPVNIMMSFVIDYLTARNRATSKSAILRGKPYVDKSPGCNKYIFSIVELVKYLNEKCKVNRETVTALKDKLHDMGGTAVHYYIDAENPSVLCWTLPIAVVHNAANSEIVIPPLSESDFLNSVPMQGQI